MPETSIRRILALPLPSTVSSSSGRMRGCRSMLTSEQPWTRRTETATATRVRMREVYPARRRCSIIAGMSAIGIEDVRAAAARLQGRIHRTPVITSWSYAARGPIGIEDGRPAAARLKGRIHRTPVIPSRSFDDLCGYRVFFKCENLQRAGAFKIRGALNKLLTLTGEERKRGVVGFSSGNPAPGGALAARLTGASAVILMPTDAPALKVAATKGYGAEVVYYDRQDAARRGGAQEQ